MSADEAHLTFGPVPSRRLGRSVGINNIPPKCCSYSCVYCQVGRTTRHVATRRTFSDPGSILSDVRRRLEEANARSEHVDFLTFVPDGEPTLDLGLGSTIDLLGELGVRIAVITNGSLLWRSDVREELMRADLVSVKVDTVMEREWRSINRPCGGLRLDRMLESTEEFADSFEGILYTETMLLNGFNDNEESISATAAFLGSLRPRVAWIGIPTRPPAECSVAAPGHEVSGMAYRMFSDAAGHAEFLTSYEGDEFSSTGDVVGDIKDILAVHPMREEALTAMLERADAPEGTLEDLVTEGALLRKPFDGHDYYVLNDGVHRGKTSSIGKEGSEAGG